MECVELCNSLDGQVDVRDAQRCIHLACQNGHIPQFDIAVKLNALALRDVRELQTSFGRACWGNHLALFKHIRDKGFLHANGINVYEILKESIHYLYENFAYQETIYSSAAAQRAKEFLVYAWDTKLIRKWSKQMIQYCFQRSRWDVLELMLTINKDSVRKHCPEGCNFWDDEQFIKQRAFYYKVFATFPRVREYFRASRADNVKHLLPCMDQFFVEIQATKEMLDTHSQLSHDVLQRCLFPLLIKEIV